MSCIKGFPLLRRSSNRKALGKKNSDQPPSRAIPMESTASTQTSSLPSGELSEGVKQAIREAWSSRMKQNKPTSTVISRNIYSLDDPVILKSLENLNGNAALQRFSQENANTPEAQLKAFNGLPKKEQKRGIWIRYQAKPEFLRAHLDEASQKQLDDRIPSNTAPTESGIDVHHRVKRIKGNQIHTKKVLALTLPGHGYLRWRRPPSKPVAQVTQTQPSGSGVLGEAIEPDVSPSGNA
jgi:hypothetical protein